MTPPSWHDEALLLLPQNVFLFNFIKFSDFLHYFVIEVYKAFVHFIAGSQINKDILKDYGKNQKNKIKLNTQKRKLHNQNKLVCEGFKRATSIKCPNI